MVGRNKGGRHGCLGKAGRGRQGSAKAKLCQVEWAPGKGWQVQTRAAGMAGRGWAKEAGVGKGKESFVKLNGKAQGHVADGEVKKRTLRRSLATRKNTGIRYD